MHYADSSGPTLLREALKTLGLSVPRFAQAVRTSRATAYRWLKGQGIPRPKQRERIYAVTAGAVPPGAWVGSEEAVRTGALAAALLERDRRRDARRQARADKRTQKRASEPHGSVSDELGFEVRVLPSPSRPIPFSPGAWPIGATDSSRDEGLGRIAKVSLYHGESGGITVVDPRERDVLLRRDAVFATAHSLSPPPRPIDEQPFTPPRDTKDALQCYAPEYGRVVRYRSTLGPVWVTPQEAWSLARRDALAGRRPRGEESASAGSVPRVPAQTER